MSMILIISQGAPDSNLILPVESALLYFFSCVSVDRARQDNSMAGCKCVQTESCLQMT